MMNVCIGMRMRSRKGTASKSCPECGSPIRGPSTCRFFNSYYTGAFGDPPCFLDARDAKNRREDMIAVYKIMGISVAVFVIGIVLAHVFR